MADKKSKQITISISDKTFNVDLAVADAELVTGFLSLIKAYVKKGLSLSIRYSYGSSFSSSAQIITKVLNSIPQVEEFNKELLQLLRVIRKPK